MTSLHRILRSKGAGGDSGRGDQIRPALPVTGTGLGHTESSAQAGTCPRRLGWAGEELLWAWREGEAHPSSLLLARRDLGPTASRVL